MTDDVLRWLFPPDGSIPAGVKLWGASYPPARARIGDFWNLSGTNEWYRFVAGTRCDVCRRRGPATWTQLDRSQKNTEG